MSNTINIILADDHALFRTALKDMLIENSEFNVIGEASSAEELRPLLRKKTCDVLVLDITLKDSTGLQLLISLREHYPSLNVLILSMHRESQYGVRALQSGAKAYLTKDTNPEELFKAIHCVAHGKEYITHSFGALLADYVKSPQKEANHGLSPQEFEVLRLVSQGMRINDIADKLHLSNKTISTYRHRILHKLNLNNTAEMIRFCINNQIS